MATPGEAFPQKCEKFVLGVELRLDPAIYFLDGAFYFPRYARSDVSKLNYKSSLHDESRIREFRHKLVDISWHSRGIFVAPAHGAGSRNSRSVVASESGKCIRQGPFVERADKNPTKSLLQRNDFVGFRKYSDCGDSCMSTPVQILRTTLVRTVLFSTILVVVWAGLLTIPQPLVRFSVRAENLVLHSDRPFSEAAGKHVLEMAERKLSRSPLFSSRQDYHVFIYNSRWRQLLLFNKDYGVGGVAQYPVTAQVFLREARVEDNRLISQSSSPVMVDRTLGYYVAHEITDQLTGADIGPHRFYGLPQWVREGYADYVGKGDSFHYDEGKRAFLSGALEMDQKKSGLYSRFHLLVAYLFDHQHWSVEQLLNAPPPQATVEDAIRGEQP